MSAPYTASPSAPAGGAAETPQQRAVRRLREWKPSPEERAILEKARARSQTYSNVFVLGAGGALFAFARQRRLALLPTFLITSTGAFLGAQAGRLASMYKGIQEMRELPQSELRNIIEDLRRDLQGQAVDKYDRQRAGLPSNAPWATPVSASPPATDLDEPADETPAPSSSVWDSIRSRGAAPSVWDKLRQNPSANASADTTPRPTASDDAPSSASPSSSEESTWDRLRHAPPPIDASSATAGTIATNTAGSSSTWDTLRAASMADPSYGKTISTPPTSTPFRGTAAPPPPASEPVPYADVPAVRTNAYGDPIE